MSKNLLDKLQESDDDEKNFREMNPTLDDGYNLYSITPGYPTGVSYNFINHDKKVKKAFSEAKKILKKSNRRIKGLILFDIEGKNIKLSEYIYSNGNISKNNNKIINIMLNNEYFGEFFGLRKIDAITIMKKYNAGQFKDMAMNFYPRPNKKQTGKRIVIPMDDAEKKENEMPKWYLKKKAEADKEMDRWNKLTKKEKAEEKRLEDEKFQKKKQAKALAKKERKAKKQAKKEKKEKKEWKFVKVKKTKEQKAEERKIKKEQAQKKKLDEIERKKTIQADKKLMEELEKKRKLKISKANRKEHKKERIVKSKSKLQKYLKKKIEEIPDITETDYSDSGLFSPISLLYALKESNNDCSFIQNKNYRENSFVIKLRNKKKVIYENEDYSTLLKVINEGIIRCKKNKKIPVMKMLIIILNRNNRRIGAHSNMLMFNWKRREIERYEPHGLFNLDENVNNEINQYIIDNLVNKLNNKYKYKFKFVSPDESCPIGLQNIVRRSNVKIFGLKSGYCSVFSSFYTVLRLRYPILSQSQLLSTVDNMMKSNPDTIKKFIVNFSKFLENYMKKWGVFSDFQRFNKIKTSRNRKLYEEAVMLSKKLEKVINKHYMEEFDKFTDGKDETLSKILNKEEIKEMKEMKEKKKPTRPARPSIKQLKKVKHLMKKPKRVKQPPKKMELDKNSIYAKYTVVMLNDIIRNHTEINKGLSTMNKGYKVNLLEKANIDKSLLPEPPVRGMRTYGIVSGKVKPYNDNEQKKFIAVNYNELHPLKSKELDSKKHKLQYEMKIKIDLNPHQKDFIVNFINSYFTGALMFHTVGAGKTLTAVAFSHYYLSLFPDRNVVIISPPTLLFNFVEAMKEFGLDIRDNRYQFFTYIKFSKNYRNIVNDKTLLIIDEIHNFRTRIRFGVAEVDGVNRKVAIKGALQDKIINACMLCKKILGMTGTPYVNKLYDIENSLSMINQRRPIEPKEFKNIVENPASTIDYFKYRISHFDVFKTDKAKFFPEKREQYIPIKIYKDPVFSKIYSLVVSGKNPYINDVDDARYYDDYGDFKGYVDGKLKTIYLKAPKMDVYGRFGHQILISEQKKDVSGNKLNEPLKFMSENKQLTSFHNAGRQFGNIINGYKIKFIIEKIKNNPNFKTIVFSSFITSALNPLRKELTKEGIKFTLITGAESAITRQKNKERFNKIDSGIDVLLISSAGTEGVSTKNVRQLFLYESQWNEALSEQAIARAIRFKSHSGLPASENYCNIYRLQICVNKADTKIVDKFNKGVFKDVASGFIEKQLELNRVKSSILRKVKKDDFKMWEKFERIAKEEAKKKVRQGFGKKNKAIPYDEDRDLHYIIIREYIKKSKNQGLAKQYTELSTQLDKMDKKHDITSLTSLSSDINLTKISIIKEVIITEFIKRCDREVPQLESFKEPLHKKLIKAIDKYQDVAKLLKKQLKILDKIGNNVFQESSEIQNYIMKSETSRLEKFNKTTEKKEGVDRYNEFFTPPEIVEELLSHSDIIDSKNFIKVLEPTAGFGNLVSGVVKARTDILDKGTYIDMIEINPKNRNVLQTLFVDKDPYQFNLLETKNFLEYQPSENYDLIVMNPPFHLKLDLNRGIIDRDMWDIDFIIKAYDMLKPGGEIMGIVSAYLSHGKQQYKKWIKNKKVQIIKKYEGYKWSPTLEKEERGKKSTKLILNFHLIKISKPE